MKFSQKNFENWRFWKSQFFWDDHLYGRVEILMFSLVSRKFLAMLNITLYSVGPNVILCVDRCIKALCALCNTDPCRKKKCIYIKKKSKYIVNDGLKGPARKTRAGYPFFLSRICSSTNFWSTYTQYVLYARFAYYIFRLKRKSIVSSNRIHAWQLYWGGSHKKRLLPVIKSRWPYSATASSNH